MRSVKTTKLAKAVGAQVRDGRKAAGMSRPALAHKVGLDRSHVWRIEKGETIPPIPTLAAIAKAVGAVLVLSLAPHAQERGTKH
jgi:transcriptional regulator with XRE-family HTH domain